MTKNVIGYLRTSSQTNVGENKDSEKRQLREIKRFCAKKKYKLVETFYDANVSGKTSLSNRKNLSSALNYCKENNIEKIIIESGDRFSRDLVNQEVMLNVFRDKGISVEASNNDKFSSENVESVLFRQMTGAINQHNKDTIVNRLKVARENIKEENYKKRLRHKRTLQNTGKCEGAPQLYITEHPNIIQLVKKVRNQNHWTLRQIANYLSLEYGIRTKTNKVLNANQVSRILKYKSING
jgi:DNA invertase Pin-like site-specific DNA recombinase